MRNDEIMKEDSMKDDSMTNDDLRNEMYVELELESYIYNRSLGNSWRILSSITITEDMHKKDNSDLESDNQEGFTIEIGMNTTVKNELFKVDDLISNFHIRRLRPTQIPSVVTDGIAISPVKYVENDKGKCNIKEGDFISCQLIGIDFNNFYIGKYNDKVKFDDLYLSYEDAKKDEFLKNNCCFIHTTASHTKELNRFRAYFILTFPIFEQKRIKDLISALIYRFNSDIDSASITQLFFGNSKCEYKYFGNIMSEEVQEELLDKYKLHDDHGNNN